MYAIRSYYARRPRCENVLDANVQVEHAGARTVGNLEILEFDELGLEPGFQKILEPGFLFLGQRELLLASYNFV